MSIVHQIFPRMVRSRVRPDHHRPAPLPSLKGAGRPNHTLHLKRSPYPTLLYRSKDSLRSRRSSREGRAMSSEDAFGLNGK
eukprot:4376613-Pyramimonas_sp.AAC.1